MMHLYNLSTKSLEFNFGRNNALVQKSFKNLLFFLVKILNLFDAI